MPHSSRSDSDNGLYKVISTRASMQTILLATLYAAKDYQQLISMVSVADCCFL
jgi:hypothetical protein